MEYISIKDAAHKWGVSERMVRRYCSEGKIKGAVVKDNTWLIPEDANKPSAKSRAHNPVHKEVPLEAQERFQRQRELCKLMQYCKTPHGQNLL